MLLWIWTSTSVPRKSAADQDGNICQATASQLAVRKSFNLYAYPDEISLFSTRILSEILRRSSGEGAERRDPVLS